MIPDELTLFVDEDTQRLGKDAPGMPCHPHQRSSARHAGVSGISDHTSSENTRSAFGTAPGSETNCAALDLEPGKYKSELSLKVDELIVASVTRLFE